MSQRRFRISVVAFLFIALAVLAAHHSFGQSIEETGVRDALMKSAASFEKNDMTATAQVWANDESLTVFESGHTNYGWTDYRDHHLGPKVREMQDTKYSFSDMKIHVSGNKALATMKYFNCGNCGRTGKTRHMDGAGLATAVLEKREGQWWIVHWHSSALQRAPTPAPTPNKNP
jgi:ketosteroid isomerase-like protein